MKVRKIKPVVMKEENQALTIFSEKKKNPRPNRLHGRTPRRCDRSTGMMAGPCAVVYIQRDICGCHYKFRTLSPEQVGVKNWSREGVGVEGNICWNGPPM